ncbi:MAG: response regulator [Magnetococcales bacterium]|nr:response regulator [Magnetococcales bacterium]
MATSFTFRVLVVEDDPDFRNYMQSAMKRTQKFVNFKMEIQYVISKQDAVNYLKVKHYHLVSLDQRFPEKIGGEIVHDTGLTLLKDIVEKYPTSSRLLYTAYPKIPYANLAGTLDSTPYFGKSIDEYDHPDEQQLTVKSWANKIQEMSEQYVSFSLPRMGKYLPPGMAQRARLMSLEFNNHEIFMTTAKELWESCLHLIWAQTLAIAAQNPHLPRPIKIRNTLYGIETELERLLPSMAKAGWLDPWLPYLGAGQTGSGENAGHRFLKYASKLWRSLRNKKAHLFSRNDWEEHRHKMHEPLLHLLDALSYWTVRPLFTHPTFDPSSHYDMRNLMVQGESLPWKEKTIRIPPGLNKLAAQDSTHLFTLWHAPDVGEFLMDLHPFVQLQEKENHHVLWTLSYLQSGKDGGWKFRSLAGGELESLPLTLNDQNYLAGKLRWT